MPAPTSMRQCSSRKAHAHGVQWSDEATLELEEAWGWRHRVRIEKRLLYNRTAPALHKHVLCPFDEGTDLCCTVCEKRTALGNLSRFLKEKCGGLQDCGEERGQREARPSVKLAYKQELVCKYNEKAQAQALHVLVVPTDMQQGVTCTLCHEEAPETWRRVVKFTRQCCPLQCG